MAVLETIMAANAAYGVIKQCLANGREVKGMVGHVGKFLNAEADLKDAVERKKKNPLTLKKSGVNWSLGADCTDLRALGTAGFLGRPKRVGPAKQRRNKKKKSVKR